MNEPDTALDNLRSIIRDFDAFVRFKGSVGEADTRVKLIDRILVEVCGWPEESITREKHVESGYIDYILRVQSRQYVAVEAKREGVAFTFPETTSRTLKVSGALLTEKTVSEAFQRLKSFPQ